MHQTTRRYARESRNLSYPWKRKNLILSPIREDKLVMPYLPEMLVNCFHTTQGHSYWDLRTSSMLGSIEWQFRTDVSGRPTSPNFKGQEAQKAVDFLIEYGTETSALHYQSAMCNIPEERRSHPHRGGSLQSVTFCVYFCVRYLCFSNWRLHIAQRYRAAAGTQLQERHTAHSFCGL